MTEYSGYTTSYTEQAPLAAPAPKARRSPTLIVLAAVTALLVIVAGVLTFSLVTTSARANHAESLASSRAKQIDSLKSDVADQRAQVAQVQGQLADMSARASKAESQVQTWRNAGAADEAFWSTVSKSSPAVTLAGKDLTISLGHAMCSAEASGISRAEVIGKNTYFPVDQMTAVVSAAETFLC